MHKSTFLIILGASILAVAAAQGSWWPPPPPSPPSGSGWGSPPPSSSEWSPPSSGSVRRKCPWWCPKNSHRDAWGCFCICDDGYAWNESGQKCVCDNVDKCMCDEECPTGQTHQPGTCKCCPQGAELDNSCKDCICPYPSKWDPTGRCCSPCFGGEVTFNPTTGQCTCECLDTFVTEVQDDGTTVCLCNLEQSACGTAPIDYTTCTCCATGGPTPTTTPAPPPPPPPPFAAA